MYDFAKNIVENLKKIYMCVCAYGVSPVGYNAEICCGFKPGFLETLTHRPPVSCCEAQKVFSETLPKTPSE